MSGSLTPSVISKGPCAAQGVRAVLDAFEGLEFLPQFRHGFLDFDLHLLPRWQQNMPFPKVIAEKDMNGTHYFRYSHNIYIYIYNIIITITIITIKIIIKMIIYIIVIIITTIKIVIYI